MGQYQQWLYAQEMDRRLQAEAESLETELLYLKDRVAILEQTLPENENVILNALLLYQQERANWTQQVRARAGKSTGSQQPDWGVMQPGWSGSFSNMQTPRPPAVGTAPYYFGQRSEQGLLPEDMLAFFNKREQASSPWQHHDTGEQHSLDAETRQQNENIRRWFERWHRESTGMAQPERWRNER